MRVNHLNWHNSVTKCAEKRGIEGLSRFPNCEKYNNHCGEIEQDRHPPADIQEIRMICRVCRIAKMCVFIGGDLKHCLWHGPQIIIEGTLKICSRGLDTAGW